MVMWQWTRQPSSGSNDVIFNFKELGNHNNALRLPGRKCFVDKKAFWRNRDRTRHEIRSLHFCKSNKRVWVSHLTFVVVVALRHMRKLFEIRFRQTDFESCGTLVESTQRSGELREVFRVFREKFISLKTLFKKIKNYPTLAINRSLWPYIQQLHDRVWVAGNGSGSSHDRKRHCHRSLPLRI